MAGTLLPNSIFTILDANGTPVSAGSITFYLTGTTTLAAVYTDSALTTPATNPVIADSAGRIASTYLNPAVTYKAIVKDGAGTIIRSIDPIGIGAALKDLSNATYMARLVPQKLADFVNVADYGWLSSNTGVENRAAGQAAADALMALGGGTLYFPPGNFNITGAISFTKPSAAIGQVNLVGSGRTGTIITQTGAYPVFSFVGNLTYSLGHEAYLGVRDMTLLGTGAAVGSRGIYGQLLSFSKFENLLIEGFEYGLYLQDIDQSTMDHLQVRFNTNGIYLDHNTGLGAGGTQPNNITILGCTVGSNSATGIHSVGGSCLNIIGGDIEYNGTTTGSASHFGLKIDTPMYQGAMAVYCHGVYFEGNTGLSDVVLVNTAGIAASGGTYIFDGCSFNRPNATSYSTNCIYTNWGTEAAVGLQVLDLRACGFKGYSPYVASAARPVIAFAGVAASADNFFCGRSNYFMLATERPVSSTCNTLLGNAYTGKVTGTASTACANGAATAVPFDTVAAYGTLPITTGSGNIILPSAGFYRISALMISTTNAAGGVNFQIYKNGNTALVVAAGAAANSNTILVSGEDLFAAGDTLTVQCTNNSGASLTYATTACKVIITKVM